MPHQQHVSLNKSLLHICNMHFNRHACSMYAICYIKTLVLIKIPSLNYIVYLFIVTLYPLIVTLYLLIVTLYLLIVTLYLLIVTLYLLIVTLYLLIVTLLSPDCDSLSPYCDQFLMLSCNLYGILGLLFRLHSNG